MHSVGNRITELPKRLEYLFTVFDVVRVERYYDEDRLPVERFPKLGERWDLNECCVTLDIIRWVSHELTIGGQNSCGNFDRVDETATQQVRADLVELELERRGDAETWLNRQRAHTTLCTVDANTASNTFRSALRRCWWKVGGATPSESAISSPEESRGHSKNPA